MVRLVVWRDRTQADGMHEKDRVGSTHKMPRREKSAWTNWGAEMAALAESTTMRRKAR